MSNTFVSPLGPKLGKGQVHLPQPEWTPPKQVPETLVLDGASISIWTFAQLTEISRDNLKQRALDLRDAGGVKYLSGVAPLQKSWPRPTVSKWIIEAEVLLGKAAGVELSAADLGLPEQLMIPAHVLSQKERVRFAEAGYSIPVTSAPASITQEAETVAAAVTKPMPVPAPDFMMRVSTTQAHYANPSLSPQKSEYVPVGVPKRPGPPLRLG